MRLSPEQISTIHTCAEAMFGADARIWLFGSRADDGQRGGDIDLYIEVDQVLENRVASAVTLAAKLEYRFQGLPVDVVLKDATSIPQTIFDIAKQTGVRL